MNWQRAEMKLESGRKKNTATLFVIALNRSTQKPLISGTHGEGPATRKRIPLGV